MGECVTHPNPLTFFSIFLVRLANPTAVGLLRLGVVFLLAVLAHVRSVNYWFASTDTLALIETSRAASPAGVVRVLTTPMLSGSRFTGFALFYRPVSSLSYTLDYALWGLWPGGYHITNVLLHGVVVVLVALAIREVTGRPLVGVVAAGLVALHPLTAEVVPSIARRQDVIMTAFLLASLVLFVRGWRRTSWPLLVGSLAAYALGLGAKEPALVFPGVVAWWVAVDGSEGSLLQRIRATVIATAPFAVVTMAYLVVRIAVLGDLGGYKRSSLPSLADGVVLVLKYLLSLTYPSDVVGVWLAPARWPLAVAVVVVIAAIVLLWRAGRSSGGRNPGDDIVIVLAIVGFAAVPVLFAVASPLDGAIPLILGYDRPVSAFVGAAYVGGCLAVAVWAVWVGPTLSSTDRASLTFFAVWLALPLVLFVRAGSYTIRSGYLSLVPAMAAVALLLVVGGRGIADDIDFEGGQPTWEAVTDADARNVALAGALLVLVLPLLTTTPVVHSYDGWRMSGEVNRVTLQAVQSEVDAAGSDSGRLEAGREQRIETVRIVGFPTRVRAQHRQFPRVKSTAYLKAGTVEAWLRLHGRENITVAGGEGQLLEWAPTGAETSATLDGTTLTVRIEYEYGSTDR